MDWNIGHLDYFGLVGLVLDLIGLNESVIFFWINHIAGIKTKNNPKIVCKTQIIENCSL